MKDKSESMKHMEKESLNLRMEILFKVSSQKTK